MGPGARRATGQHKNVVILVSSHGGMKTDIEEHQPACENITNIDVDLIRQPEAPNWPTVPPPSPFPHLLLRSLALIFDI